MGTARHENQLDRKTIAPQRSDRPPTSRSVLLKVGCCLASLSLLSRGMAWAEEILEIEVYDYEPAYEPAPADYYQPPPESAYVEPSWQPETYYYQEPEPYYSQPAPEPYYYQEPESYYSQPAPDTYYYQEPAPEPYYYEPAPEPYYYQEPEPYYYQEPEPYYSQPAPEPYYYQEPEPYYSQPAPEPYYYPEPEPYYSQPAPSYQKPIAEMPKLPPLEKLEEPSFLPDDLYVAPPTALNLNKKSKGVNNYYGSGGNNYIDRSSDYQIGATDSYEAPSAVVFSERSTGCEAVLQTGQGIVGSVCDRAEPAYVANDNWSAPTANNWSAPTENNWSAPTANNWSAPTENNWSAPTANNWSAPAQTASSYSHNSPSYSSNSSYNDSYYSNSSYYDNSYYSEPSYNDNSYYSNSSYYDNSYYSDSSYGSGYNYEPEGVQVASILPARVQGLFEINPMSNSGLAYYNRTMRPPAVRGNGDKKMLFPLSLPAPITSLFGWRNHPILGYQKFHTGTDLGAETGTPVVAAYAGHVTIADWLGGYGVAVAIEHQSKSLETVYGHLSEIFVKPGEFVQQGEVIGRVGSTGRSTGPHLHFELRELTPDGWVTRSPDSQIEAAMASLMAVLKIKEVPPAPEISLEDLSKQTKDVAGKPQLPPLPPGFEVPIPDLVPPVFELTKASEKKGNSQLTQKVEEKKE